MFFIRRSDHLTPPINSACQGKAGFELKPFGSWRTAPSDAYIVGLKELPEGEDGPLSHTHIFFAHCFKNQGGWTDILGRFDAGNGTILDLEFLNDAQGRRVAAFGYHAGFAGAAIGVDDWCHQKLHPNEPLPAYKPFPNEHELISYIKGRLSGAGNDPLSLQGRSLIFSRLRVTNPGFPIVLITHHFTSSSEQWRTP